MPFNANTYRKNKHRRQAWAELAEARAIRERVRAGAAWEAPRIATYVQLARISMRLYLLAVALQRIERGEI